MIFYGLYHFWTCWFYSQWWFNNAGCHRNCSNIENFFSTSCETSESSNKIFEYSESYVSIPEFTELQLFTYEILESTKLLMNTLNNMIPTCHSKNY
uniref:Uncharacterized protein n=1 Tax=Strongyloides venezuelensis TaxID=75913 RepID=A0A0K0F4R9_STRVS